METGVTTLRKICFQPETSRNAHSLERTSPSNRMSETTIHAPIGACGDRRHRLRGTHPTSRAFNHVLFGRFTRQVLRSRRWKTIFGHLMGIQLEQSLPRPVLLGAPKDKPHQKGGARQLPEWPMNSWATQAVLRCYMPVPVSVTVTNGVKGSLVFMFTAAGRNPRALGENLTLIVHDRPAPSVAPQVVVLE
jgi:hypothetical protein